MRRLLTLALLLAPLPALAHTGNAPHAHGLVSGFLHPLGGLDHLAAMIAVGAWAGLIGGRARWLVPAAFVAAMALGGMLGIAGVALPLVESGILASVIVLGALVAASAQVGTVPAMALASAFGLFHGHAHGAEMSGSVLGFLAGMLAATALLHGIGVAVTAVQNARVALRFAGGAAAGVALLAMALA